MRWLNFITLALSILLGCQCTKSRDAFYAKHFPLRMAPQGQPPFHFSNLEKSLEPTACKSCHIEQFEKWSQSLHSQAMTSGILWELPSLPENQRENCFKCHSPLYESRELVRDSLGIPKESNLEFSKFLPQNAGNHGILCASCHIRNYKRLGPVSSNSLIQQTPHQSRDSLPHNGFKTKAQFSKSEFCKTCHESPVSGLKLEGKKLMETYSEWNASAFSAQGIQCQTCHMPNRNHEWKGIHDKNFVLSGLMVEFKAEPLNAENNLKLIGKIKSINIGHRFPTYAVPLVKTQILGIRSKSGIKEVLNESFIGRQVDIHLTNEVFDTRLFPGEERLLEAIVPFSDYISYDKFLFEATVIPDEMYIRKFEHNLKDEFASKRSLDLNQKLRESLDLKIKNTYQLFSKEIEINPKN